MKIQKFLAAALTAVLLVISLPPVTLAQISVNDVVIHMARGQRPIKNIVVRNSAEDVFYVTASASRLDSSEVTGLKEVPAENLLISPKTFSVPGKGERTVRVVLKAMPKDKEEVYQISFSPSDKGFDESARVQKNLAGRQISIRVLTGMGVLLFVDPVDPKPRLLWERHEGRVTFTNPGNQHVRLMFGKACRGSSTSDEKCESLPAKRVHPGQIFEINVHPESVIKYVRRDGASGEYQPVTINPGEGSGEVTPTPDSEEAAAVETATPASTPQSPAAPDITAATATAVQPVAESGE